MNLRLETKRRPLGFDMTPMIDVVFLLLIFFLFTSQLSQVMRSPIDLPEETGDTAEHANPGTVVIDVTGDGAYLIEGQVRPMEDIVRLISLEQQHAEAIGQTLDLLIRADRKGPAVHINTLANRLASVGVRQWKLGTAVPRARSTRDGS